ncbi:glycosyltransferase family 4 protein [Candidatus Hydrogenedentota bacterium]
MRILHLFSNWKWTGPAEPATSLAATLAKRGHEVYFACGRPPGRLPNAVAEHAKEYKLRPETRFMLKKHLNLPRNLFDSIALPRYIKKKGIDIIHTHMTNDHLLGGKACAKMNPPVSVVRSSYEGEGLADTRRNRMLVTKYTDALIVASRKAKGNDIERFGISPKKAWQISTAIDTERFDPSRELESAWSKFGIRETDYVVGIVARMQTHRRFEVLLEAVQIASHHLDNLKMLIVGRGTNMQKVAVGPAREMGLLRNTIIFSGYQKGDDYVATLAAMDAKIFLMPGSDGTCRAVREALAMGVPVITARRGMLDEIVSDGSTGLVIDDTAANLADAIVKLGRDGALRKQMSGTALKRARKTFSLDTYAEKVERVYLSLLKARMSK